MKEAGSLEKPGGALTNPQARRCSDESGGRRGRGVGRVRDGLGQESLTSSGGSILECRKSGRTKR
jgi:hypothetical protein